ncbi:hypothetical protein PYW07_015406 [Mythimna separata]|uniref:Uncharacterized protein n=1 Tax=Mythimna separata TaxID=271217 RepID=A0AAD7YZZ2_MYTSE|nr:hypothetical protein PYW07_015406 [Mythimna separata]
MKPTQKNGYQSDDDNVRYKLNTNFFNNAGKSPKLKKIEKVEEEDDNIRYKFPTVLNKPKPAEQKPKPKQKIKVNFWSNKQLVTRLHNPEPSKQKNNRRHTVGATAEDTTATKPKHSAVKVRKRVSFLPSPIFSENHVPMVTVPDDLTIQLNEEEANDLAEDLNLAFVNSAISNNKTDNSPKRKAKNANLINPRDAKRKRSLEDEPRNHGNENELEFFSKYIVQKLRRMETNQRIYSENLINTVLMLGQLGKLNGKSKIAES